MVKVRKKIRYILREFITFLFHCLVEVWHFIKIILKDAILLVAFCSIMTILITRPVWVVYNNIAKEKIVETGIEAYRMYAVPDLSEGSAKTLAKTTENYILYQDIPEFITNTLIDNVDPTFEDNKGVDWNRIIDAIKQIKETQGNVIMDIDTITQKVVETVFLQNEKGVDKYCEKVLMALKMNKYYSKRSIMEIYCNVIDCANGTKGIQQASYKYFGKDVRDLSIREQMYICVIMLDARDYNPYKNLSGIANKCDILLDQAFTKGYITESEYKSALKEKVTILRDNE